MAFATVCERCLVIQQPDREPPRPLPTLHQSALDHRTYEDSYLYIVLPEGTPAPEAAAVVAAISGTDLHISDAAPAPRHRGHRPAWEWVFSAQDPDRPFQRWESGPSGVSPRAGERVHVWLEETGLPADMGLLSADLLPEVRAYIHGSRWSIGLHCDTTDDPSWNTRLMMRLVRCILPEREPLVVERATGRVLLDVWREAAELKPPPLQDCYAVRVVERDGVAWLHTRGLPRWGCFELEILGVPASQADAARQLIDAVAAMLVPMAALPPPWRAIYFSNGAGFAWVPQEHISERLASDLPGQMRSDRRALKHATVALVSPYFQPELFAEIVAMPPPPTAQAEPQTAALSSSAMEASPAIDSSVPALAPAGATAAGPGALPAALLSLFLPGLGQILLGQTLKGAVMFGASVVTCYGLGLWPLLAAIDAWVLAERRQQRALGEWEVFWYEP